MIDGGNEYTRQFINASIQGPMKVAGSDEEEKENYQLI